MREDSVPVRGGLCLPGLFVLVGMRVGWGWGGGLLLFLEGGPRSSGRARAAGWVADRVVALELGAVVGW